MFEYSFDKLADVIEGFVELLKLTRYALYIFDYGAPTGLRLAMKHPERISAIMSQNGNAYVEGLSKELEPWQAYCKDPSPENREAVPRVASGRCHSLPVHIMVRRIDLVCTRRL